MSKKVALITGSTRTPCAGDQIVSWVSSILETRPTDNLTISPLRIADFNLPVYDEPVVPFLIPAMQQFTHEHSKKWSAAIASFDAYIFVIPEYNAGLAGGTKNAIDYLLHEWTGKPVAIISYGAQGGTFANEQLARSLGLVMKMKVVETKVLLAFATGSDPMHAATEGKVGEESLKGWAEKGKKEEVLKAVGEIAEVLRLAEKADEVTQETS
jgi:NAD(P)H-dependent FMN reductase